MNLFPKGWGVSHGAVGRQVGFGHHVVAVAPPIYIPIHPRPGRGIKEASRGFPCLNISLSRILLDGSLHFYLSFR